MSTFKNREEAFASQNFDPTAVELIGVPEQHIDAVKGFINLCVAHDAANKNFQPDYSNYSQPKYENFFELGSPAGVGFRFGAADRWRTVSGVGARLVSESRKKANNLAEICEQDYKAMMTYERPSAKK